MSRRSGLCAAGTLLGLTLGAVMNLSPMAAVSARTLPGLANVASAGSLQLLMDKYMGPPFISATGDEYPEPIDGQLFGLARGRSWLGR